MKQITLNIADDNYDFFMELMKKLNFMETESQEDDEIPEHVKEMVRERQRTFKRENAMTWKEVKTKLSHK